MLERTKHCGVCNRCVEVFDHHCNWLNNCIGKQNYGKFIVLLLLVCAFCMYHVAIDVWVVATLYRDSYLRPVSDFYSYSDYTAKVFAYVLVSVCLATQVLCIGLALQLLLLHRWLKQKGLTTFEYILFLREKNEHPELQLEGADIRNQHKSKVLVRVREEGKREDAKFDSEEAKEGSKPESKLGSDKRLGASEEPQPRSSASEGEVSHPQPAAAEEPSAWTRLCNCVTCRSAARTVPAAREEAPQILIRPDVRNRVPTLR